MVDQGYAAAVYAAGGRYVCWAPTARVVNNGDGPGRRLLSHRQLPRRCRRRWIHLLTVQRASRPVVCHRLAGGASPRTSTTVSIPSTTPRCQEPARRIDRGWALELGAIGSGGAGRISVEARPACQHRRHIGSHSTTRGGGPPQRAAGGCGFAAGTTGGRRPAPAPTCHTSCPSLHSLDCQVTSSASRLGPWLELGH